jgi:hypothetical protein
MRTLLYSEIELNLFSLTRHPWPPLVTPRHAPATNFAGRLGTVLEIGANGLPHWHPTPPHTDCG